MNQGEGAPQVLAFRIDGRPSAWARARVAGKRFFKSREQEAAQRHIANIARMAAYGLFFEGPVELHCKFHFQRPKKGKATVKWFASRPDGDNLIKQIKDSLNEVVWKDDAQVVRGTYEKLYSDVEYTWVEIRALHPV